jgi:hypothetical protein
VVVDPRIVIRAAGHSLESDMRNDTGGWPSDHIHSCNLLMLASLKVIWILQKILTTSPNGFSPQH